MEKDRRLRFLVNTNAPWVNSGYAVEARDLMERFVKDGWKAGVIGFTGLEGSLINMGYPVYPRMGDTWGSDAMLFHGRHFQANFLLSFHDVWVLNPQLLQQLTQERAWIPYVPIDQDPIPPNVLSNLRFAYKIITFSKFGQQALMRNGFTSTFIPEGTDTNIFKPMDKMQCRKELGIPQDAFVVGMIGANKENPPRKGWQQALEAFKLFHDKHPEAIFFYQTNQNSPGGFPIVQYAHYLGIEKQLFHIDEYMGTFHTGSEVIAKMLNSFDFLTHASLSEGFGLIIIEAQACGTPVIVNDCQSQPELIIPEKTGLICKTGYKYFTSALGFYHFPDVNSLYEKYEQLYRSDRKKMGEAARQHIVKNYNIDTIVENRWIPTLTELQDELLGNLKNQQRKD